MLVTLQNYSAHSTALAFIVLILSVVLFITFRPFEGVSDNVIGTMSLVVLTTISGLSVVVKVSYEQFEGEQTQLYSRLCFGCIIVWILQGTPGSFFIIFFVRPRESYARMMQAFHNDFIAAERVDNTANMKGRRASVMSSGSVEMVEMRGSSVGMRRRGTSTQPGNLASSLNDGLHFILTNG